MIVTDNQDIGNQINQEFSLINNWLCKCKLCFKLEFEMQEEIIT